MAYIFMDESGDLGFDFNKAKTSHFFVITFLFLKDHKVGDKIIKKHIAGLTKLQRKRCNGVIHFHREEPKVRMKILSQLSKLDTSIMSIYINKKSVYTNLRDQKHILYNYITNILLDRIVSKKLIPTDHIKLIVAKRETNKFLNENFSNYISEQALNQHNLNITLSLESYYSSTYKCLQLADAASWSIFRKLEYADDSYYNHIKSLIIEENKLFG